MAARSSNTHLALLSGSILIIACARVGMAAPATLEVMPKSPVGEVIESLEIGGVKPLREPKKESTAPIPRGNPLWSVPLSTLTATQERPIFSASRRPPPRAVAGPRIDPVSAPAPQIVAVPERPALALIGAVVGDNDAIAVFIDRTSQGVVRLRTGEAHMGWVLSSVVGREASLTKDDRTEVLVLTRPDTSPPGATAAPGIPTPVDGAGMSDAPFIPRSTPKNGESDGL